MARGEWPAFTEAQWLASADPAAMISVIFSKTPERTTRLFMVACCRRVERWMPEPSRQGLKVMERAANNLPEFRTIRMEFPEAAIGSAFRSEVEKVSESYSALSAFGLALTPLTEGHLHRFTSVAAAAAAMDGRGPPDGPDWQWGMRGARRLGQTSFEAWDDEMLVRILQGGPEELSRFPGWAAERNAQAELLRHIVGNPFRPYPAPAIWPSTVVELAQAVYDGTGDHRVLSDSLEDAGHAELAAHFRQEEWHPRGCWGLDLLLKKSGQ